MVSSRASLNHFRRVARRRPHRLGYWRGSGRRRCSSASSLLILGVIVSFHPSGSLNVLAVLLGVLMIFSGIFHLIRVFDPEENHGSGSASRACYSSLSAWS